MRQLKKKGWKQSLAGMLIVSLLFLMIPASKPYAESVSAQNREEQKSDDKVQDTETDAKETVLSTVDEEYMNQISEEPITETKDSGLTITSTAAILMEGSTGQVIYEKNSTQELRPASITKVMTLLLIFEALEKGQIKLTDMVTVSEHAASMGGSQVYLEPLESQDVNTMIKCISIASANDASVAMAEFLAGSEEAFVQKMNERAKELGMDHTHFVNCYGLDTDDHYSCARDVALMSREMITKHPEISKYSTVWMDTFVHTTRKGQTEFGLTNTNKLIKSYPGITGLKTGSTGLAKYCLSATARKNNMDLIAVVMAAPDTKTRFAEAAHLLDYGFANLKVYQDTGEGLVIPPVEVRKGVLDAVDGVIEKPFAYLCIDNVNPAEITREVVMKEFIMAPFSNKTPIGEVIYSYQGKELGRIPILSSCGIKQAGYMDYFVRLLQKYF